jgi:hypothetical protein
LGAVGLDCESEKLENILEGLALHCFTEAKRPVQGSISRRTFMIWSKRKLLSLKGVEYDLATLLSKFSVDVSICAHPFFCIHIGVVEIFSE